MNLIVNRSAVSMAYLPFEAQSAGHILQLLIAEGCEPALCEETPLHAELVRVLGATQPSGGIMDKPEPENGWTEVRILGGLMLEAIDMMRRAGLGVKEMA